MFPHLAEGCIEHEPLPRPLARALRKADAADAAELSGAAAAPARHIAELLATLPEETRREVALTLQQQRTGLRCADVERRAAAALAELPCGWRPEDVHELFGLALDGVGPRHPTRRWDAEAEACLLLPLAALRELTPEERLDFQPQLRTLLAVLGATDDPGTAPDRARIADELRSLLPPLSAETDALLPAADPYGAAVRLRLGSTLYQPGTHRLLELCTGAPEVRPPYPWLGKAGELLGYDTELRVALRELLAAAVLDGADSTGPAGFGLPSGRLLGALAWAACVSQDARAITQLRLAASGYAGSVLDELDEGPAHFLRATLAALAALTGEPGAGQHRRLLADPKPSALRLARQALTELRDLPAGFDPRALKVPAGPYTAVFETAPTGRVELLFRNEHGKTLATVPTRVRERHPARYAALRSQLAALRRASDRYLGTLNEYWAAGRPVPASRWLAGFQEQPALAPMAAALVWQAELPSGTVLGTAFQPRNSTTWLLRDLKQGLHELADDTPVSLWRPGTGEAERELAKAWRAALARRGLREQAVPQLADGA